MTKIKNIFVVLATCLIWEFIFIGTIIELFG